MKRALPLLIAVVCLPVARAEQPPSMRELVEVCRVSAPVLLEERSPGGCEGMTAENIEILEDGEASPALRLEQGSRRAVHAILIDAGPRLFDAMREARKAALAYVGSLPEQEPALLATFDRRLILHSPLSTDRERFAGDLQWIESGGGSHLLEATRQVIEYLRSRPERKVLLLVTDGCDSLSGGKQATERLIELAARTESLVIFTVGLNVPQRCEEDDSDPDLLLEALAEQTGGQYLKPTSQSQLESMFGMVRERMAREQQVIYAPPPFGEGPKDKPRRRSFRWRRVTLRTTGSEGCRIRLAGSPLRYESAERSRFGAAPGADGGADFTLDESGDLLRGELQDIVRESGPMAPSMDLLLGLERGGSEQPGRELTKRRNLLALIPPFDQTVRPGATREDPIRQALANIMRIDPDSSARSWSEVPLLVNGRTLLDARRSLALALWQHPDYRRWAFERVREERLKEMDEMIASAAEGERAVLTRARRFLAEEEWSPEPSELEMHLGAWLGDIPVASVFNTAELWMAQSLLGAVREKGAGEAAAATADADRSWEILSAWFPPPQDARLVGLLVPGYDPALDVIGYYRVILAPPHSATIHQMLVGVSSDTFLGSSSGQRSAEDDSSLYRYLQSYNFSRGAPLGTHLLAWMLEQNSAAAALLEGFDVKEVRYAHPSLRNLQPTLLESRLVKPPSREDFYLARLVTLVLESRSEPGNSVAVNAYMRRNPESDLYDAEPICLVPPAEPPDLLEGRRLWASLVAAKSRSSVPCLLISTPAEQ